MRGTAIHTLHLEDITIDCNWPYVENHSPLSLSLPYRAAIVSVRYGLLAMAMLPYFLKHFRNDSVIVLAKNAWLSYLACE